MSAPDGFIEVRQGSAFGWLRSDVAGLGLDPFWATPEPLPGAKGRGGVGVLELPEHEVVVRPCRRGGALGSLLKDRYASANRVRSEIEVLLALRNEGVPTVAPIAAVGKRHGAFWRLRMCTERVPDAEALPAFLAREPDARRRTAEAVGTLLKLAFAAGLQHPDLHLDNILCSRRGERVRAVLVDLDRARVKPPLEQRDTDAMLVRMARYVVRHKGRMAAVPTRAEELRLLRALGLSRADRKTTYARLRQKLQRSLKNRSWLRSKTATAAE